MKLPKTFLEGVAKATAYAKDQRSRYLEKALQVSLDAGREGRLAAGQCPACFYLVRGFAGQAFTEFTCQICGEAGSHPNTAVPKLCTSCSKDHGLCIRCLATLDLELPPKKPVRIRKR